jgi:hypothetical protein
MPESETIPRPGFSSVKVAFLLGVAILVAIASIRASLAQVLRVSNPALAVKIGSTDGIALALRADQKVVAAGQRAPLKSLAADARQALMLEPVNPAALRIAALHALATDNRRQAARLLRISDRLSRRDFGTQLLLIEQETARGDIPRTLHHFDSALRTTGQASAVLFPILANALSEPEIRVHFARLVLSDPPWLLAFMNHVWVDTANGPGFARSVIEAGSIPDRPELKEASSRLVSSLAANGQPFVARAFAATVFGKNANSHLPSGINEQTTDARLRPLTWEPVSGASLGSAVEDGGRAIRLYANSSERGIVLRRAIFLPAGRFSVRIRMSVLEPGERAEISGSVRCTNGKRAIWGSGQVPVNGLKEIDGTLFIPPNCGAQWVEIGMAGGTGQTGADVLVQEFEVVSTNPDEKGDR